MTHAPRLLFAPLSAPADLAGEIPLVGDVTWGELLNDAGTLTAAAPRDRLPSTVTRSTVEPGRTAVYVDRDGTLLWGGILWAAVLSGDTVQLGAAGFHSYFRRRKIRETLTWTAADQLTIARGLIDYAQAAVGGNIGVDTSSTPSSGRTRTRRYYPWSHLRVGEALDNLAAVNDGFNFRYETSYDAGAVTTAFVTQYPPSGRPTQLVLEVGANCDLVGLVDDATQLANRVDAIGAGEGASQLVRTAVDTSKIGTYPLLDDDVAHLDVTRSATLSEHAERALSRASVTVSSVELALNPDQIPRLGSYEVGDQVRVKIDEGWAQVDATFVIVETSTSYTVNGEFSTTVRAAALETLGTSA